MLRNNTDARRCSYFELGLPVYTLDKVLPSRQRNWSPQLTYLRAAVASLVPRPVRAMRVTRGGLEPKA